MSLLKSAVSGGGKRISRISALCLSAAALLGIFSSAPVNADDKGWVLTQKSATFGDQYVYISPNGMKVYKPQAQFAIVTHAPDWDITLYNDKTRVYYNTTLEKWRSELEAHRADREMENAKWTKVAYGNILGLRAAQYVMNGGGTLHVRHGRNRPEHSIRDATYWVSEDITVPSALASLLSAAYGMPATQNVPLRMTCTDGGAKRTMLDTYRSQQTPIPISYFECPIGYALAKTEAEVWLNDEEKQMANDLARDLSPDTAPSTTASGQATAPASSAASTSSSATTAGTATAPGAASNTINVGGLNLDKAKVQKFLENLRKQQQQQQQ